MKLSLGLDFGTESVRAVLVDLQGRTHGSAVVNYRHGQLTETLPGSTTRLPPDFALQHPEDWLDSAARATRSALRAAKAKPANVLGIGIDFTSCTMLPALADGTPLCCVEKWRHEKFAWPKLWKHHGAKAQTERINALACERQEPWLESYGGVIGLEWFFPKMLETLERAPRVFAAAEVWLEAGDWLVWQLVGSELVRSTCQAGYKAMWDRDAGFPSSDYFKALHPNLENVVVEKLPGRFLAPGQCAGHLTGAMAKKLGLREGTPVSTAIIDAHAGVPGAGAAEPDTLVMVMGTSSCHMLNSTVGKHVPGVAGIVRDGILPGFYGYETGQAAVGDAFDWTRRLLGNRNFAELSQQAGAIAPGADGVRCLDWFNGCRTPLMDGTLTGSFAGLTLNHRPPHLFRSVLEASACGLRWIVDVLREGGVPVERFVATGGLPHHSPLFLQICADVLGERIVVPATQHGPALGSATLGALAASYFSDPSAAIRAMAGGSDRRTIAPNRKATKAYDRVYADYRRLTSMKQSS